MNAITLLKYSAPSVSLPFVLRRKLMEMCFNEVFPVYNMRKLRVYPDVCSLLVLGRGGVE